MSHVPTNVNRGSGIGTFSRRSHARVAPVDRDTPQETAEEVHLELRWNGSSDATTDRFELRREADGQLLIARQDTIAG